MTLQDPLDLVGRTVAEKYAIEGIVGEGGFAVVYRATHKVWNRPVAIKVFRALGDLPAARRKQLVDAFIQEGRLLADLSERSAAICQARDVGVLNTDGREIPFMVLEWLEGQSLDQVFESEKAAGLPPRTPVEAHHLLSPAAEALALAHKKGIAHRDVKPANVFILGEPRGEFTVKILDFGIAKVVQDIQRSAFEKTQGVVSSFTPAYGAPEQFSRAHGATGPWTDVFALALIFTELVTGEPALRGDDLTQLAFCSMDPKIRPTPRAYGVDIPDALEAVLRKALSVSVEDRYRSMGEFWDALRSSLAMESMRSLSRTDSHRGAAVDLAGVPPGSRPSGAGPLPGATVRASAPFPGATAPLFPPTDTNRTMAIPGPGIMPPVAPPAKPRSVAALFAGLGAAVAGAGLLVVGGVWFFGIRGKDNITPPPSAAPPPSAVAPTTASAVASAAAPPECPKGMARVPAGKFFMGSDDKSDAKDERPAHQVELSSYCIDLTEVTVAQYKQCSDRGECKRAPRENEWPGIDAHDRKIYDPLCTIRDPDAKAQHPINCVDWELADAFCRAAAKRLPTEAEWEYATRGSDGRKYPWGDDPPKGGHLNACGKECVAWGKKNGADVAPMYSADDGFATTAPVGSFPSGASPFGLQDVVGNVFEWVSDWYGPYEAGKLVDPKGPSEGTERVMRGGAWNGSEVAWVRPTFRFKSMPTLRSHGIGFRCARDLVVKDR